MDQGARRLVRLISCFRPVFVLSERIGKVSVFQGCEFSFLSLAQFSMPPFELQIERERIRRESIHNGFGSSYFSLNIITLCFAAHGHKK